MEFQFFFILRYNNLFINIVLVIFLLLFSYGACKGFIQIIYSLNLRRKSNNKKLEIIKIVVLCTEILAFIVVLLQLISELKLN